MSFLNPGFDASGDGMQITRALNAIGSGGILCSFHRPCYQRWYETKKNQILIYFSFIISGLCSLNEL
ncbi:hypothetical protein [Inconstantimicrobium porci]|uniref:hypothetical protein n=1 Tax=Inconstantimicrobium porci TaxID=2652291 RepID=UPI0034E04C7B